MRTIRFTSPALALGSSLLLALPVGCNEELGPNTQVWLASEPHTVGPSGSICDLEGIRDGQAIAVAHVLPRDVALDVPVQVTVQTPCDSVEATMMYTKESLPDPEDENTTHERRVARTTIAAPNGASCDVTVTVEVANDRHVCSQTADADPMAPQGDTAAEDCVLVQDRCDEEPLRETGG